MITTLFGGSFNPPHLGHALIIQEFVTAFPDKQLWILPTYRHAFGKDLLSVDHRMHMCQLLLDYLQSNLTQPDQIKLCSIEIDEKLDQGTQQTISHLKSRYHNTTFEFLMGADLLCNFHKWYNYNLIVQSTIFHIYPRAGFEMSPLEPNMTPFTPPHHSITNISSTLVRKRLQKNLPTNLLLPVTIQVYIQTNQLFI